MLNILVLYLGGLGTLLFVIFLGHLLLKVCKIPLVDRAWGNFMAALIGISVLVVAYAIFKTNGKTVMVVLVPLLALLCYTLSDNIGKKHHGNDKVINPIFNIGLLPITVIYSCCWLWCLKIMMGIGNGGHFGELQLPHIDQVYYAKISIILNKTGVEANSLRNFLEGNTVGTLPYHYFEIWFNAMLTNFFPGMPPLLVFELCTWPVFFATVGIGFYAIARALKLPLTISLVIGASYFLFRSLEAYYVPQAIDLLHLNTDSFFTIFGLQEQLSVSLWVKEIALLLFWLPAVYYYLKKMYAVSFVLVGFIMVASIVTIPMVLAGVGVVILQQFRYLGWRVLYGLVPFLTVAGIGLFYLLFPTIVANDSTLKQDGFAALLSNALASFSYISWLTLRVGLISLAFPLVLAAVYLYLSNGPKAVIIYNGLVKTLPVIGMAIGGASVYLCFANFFNGSQFLTVLSGPIITTMHVGLLVLCCGTIIKYKKAAKFGLGISLLLCVTWVAYGFKTMNTRLVSRNKLFKLSIDRDYYLATKKMLDNAAYKQSEHNIGYLINTDNVIDNLSVPSISTLGNVIMLHQEDIIPVPVAAYTDARIQQIPEIKDMVKDASFYHFYFAEKKKNPNASVFDLQRAFIAKYHISHLFVDASVPQSVRQNFRTLVTDSVIDARYKEQLWQLK